MGYIIKYHMLTGAAERHAETRDEAAQAVETLKLAGARPITVEYEDERGRRQRLAHISFGDVGLPSLQFRKDMPGGLPKIADRRIDPSLHSISLADARRPDCPLIYVNKGFERLTGYRQEEVVGRNCRFLQGAATSPDAVDRMRSAIATGDAIILDLLNYRKDGSAFWNRVSLKPVLSKDGQLTHVIGIQSDITRLVSLQDNLEEWAKELSRS